MSNSSSQRKPGSSLNLQVKNWIPAFAGMTAYVVGGAVRDRLLGRPTDDLDIVIKEDPSHIAKKMASELGGSAFALDEERGIVRVAFSNQSHIDIAKIQGKTFEADLDRRDITINAMAVPLSQWAKPTWKKHIIDRHQGLADLKKKRIVPLSATVFKEDPLRLLRVFRIAAELEFHIPSTTIGMVARNKTLIKKPAPERKREEMLRLFAAPNSYAVLVLMEKSGLLDQIFPESKILRKTAPRYYGKGGVLKHTLESIQCFEDILTDKSWFPGMNVKLDGYLSEKFAGHTRRAHCKWGLLLHDIGKPATMKMIKGRLRFFDHEHVGAKKVPAMAKRYRWFTEETTRYANYVRHHMRPGNLASHEHVTDKAIHRFFRDLGDDAIAMLLISLGDHLSYLSPRQRLKRSTPHEKVTMKMVRRFYTHREKILPPRLVNGNDVMRAFNLKPSPLIGALLNDLQEAQSEADIGTKEAALRFLKERLPAFKDKFDQSHPV